MKRLFLIVVVALGGFFFLNFTSPSINNEGDKDKVNTIEIPENVQAVIDNSCYGCHNSDSKNLKSKNKLNFDKLEYLKTYKAVGKLSDVAEITMEGEMPPEKFLKKYPDHALTDDGKKALVDWANSTAKKLAGN